MESVAVASYFTLEPVGTRAGPVIVRSVTGAVTTLGVGEGEVGAAGALLPPHAGTVTTKSAIASHGVAASLVVKGHHIYVSGFEGRNLSSGRQAFESPPLCVLFVFLDA